MRNLFDQYTQPENRLTHALAVCLDEDRDLLREFLAWLDVPPSTARLRELIVVEQTLPGDPPESEEEAEQRGLPDIVIHDDDQWCVLVESKIQARLTENQLARHERTLRHRGFDCVYSVALTKAGIEAPVGMIGRSWSGLYEWLGKVGHGCSWPTRFRAYLRVAEVRLAREEYLTEGTLTMFDGFKFDADNPYTYGEAKRLLKLATAELRKDRTLIALGMDPRGEGRAAITGRKRDSVWDYLPLRDRPKDGSFTRFPHLTLSIHTDHVEVAVTIPNGVIRVVRKRLARLGEKGVGSLNGKILQRATRIVALGGFVEAYAVQRHYKTQSSPATVDARVDFKLETSQPGGRSGVRNQPEWTQLFAALLERKRSNVQFGYMIRLPWGTIGLDTRDALRLIAESWCALEPLLAVLRTSTEGKRRPSGSRLLQRGGKRSERE